MTVRRQTQTIDRVSLRDLRRDMLRGLAIAIIPTVLSFATLFLTR